MGNKKIQKNLQQMFKKLTASFRTKASSKDNSKDEIVPEEAKSSEEVKSKEPQEEDEDKLVRKVVAKPSKDDSSIIRSRKTMPISKVKKGLGKGLGDSIGASLTSGIKKSGKVKAGIE